MTITYATKPIVLSVGCSLKTLLFLSAMFSSFAVAMPVQLENTTATFSQGPFGGCPCPPSQSIDGIFFTGIPGVPNGWAIDRLPEDVSTSETAVWQTVQDIGPGPLTFTMFFLDPNPGHLLGHLRLSVTTDDRSTYADGLAVGGNVSANWTVLTGLSVQGPSGMTFTILPDDSVLAGGVIPGQGVYGVTALTDVSGITGIRL